MLEARRLAPSRIALGVADSSGLEPLLIASGFSTASGVQQLLDDVQAGRLQTPELLIIRDTGERAIYGLVRVRSLPQLAMVPIVIVLVGGGREDQLACERASALAVLREPVSQQALLAAIEASEQGSVRIQVAKHAGQSHQLVQRLSLRFRTPTEVHEAASMLAELCPQPERQKLGLCELLMNAVEHGNLELSGQDKAELLGRDEWDGEVAKRLADPRFAGREVTAALTRYPDHVELVVEDAGPGFDWRAQLNKAPDFSLPNGRGLSLAREMAFDSLEFLGRGNVAIARARYDSDGGFGASIGVSDWERRSIEVRMDDLLGQNVESDFFDAMLRACEALTGSARGVIGYVDTFGAVVIPACHTPDQSTRVGRESYARTAWTDGWKRALDGWGAHVGTEGLGLEMAGLPARAEPTLSAPIQHAGRTLGALHLSGASTGYTGLDVERLEIAVAKLAPVFAARVDAAMAWRARHQLEEASATAQHEQEAAAHIMQCLLRQGADDVEGVRSYMSSKETFNGDLLLAGRTPDKRLRVMLGDFVGHGLAAAIGGLPLSSIFHATTRKQVPLREVLFTVNESLRSFLPGGHFCCGILLELDERSGTLSIWNGGMPPALLSRSKSAELVELASSDPPLAVVSGADMGFEVQTIAVEPGDQIVIMSDGVLEFQGANGELFGLERVKSAIRGVASKDPIDVLVDTIYDFAGVMLQSSDDLSLVRVDVGAPPAPES
jgi:Stage II sporulation protein E (SpoIIE)/Histidine kinase-like ATPase domain